MQNALATAGDNAQILPATFDAEGFARDVNLFAALSEFQTAVESLASEIDDTRLAVGAEAMKGAGQTYKLGAWS